MKTKSYIKTNIDKLISPELLRRYTGFSLDIITAASAFILSYVTIFGYEANILTSIPGIEEKSIGFVAIFFIFYAFFSVHRGSWRYVSIPDLTNIIRVSLFTVITYTVVSFLVTRGSNLPRSAPVLTLLYLVAGLSSSRLIYRLLMERAFFSPSSDSTSFVRKSRNVLLYGLTDNTESFIRANRRGTKSEFNVIGILDDGILNQSRMIQGVKVLGDFSSLASVVSRLDQRGYKISELILTDTGNLRNQLAEIVEKTSRLGIKASRIPDFTVTSALTSGSVLQPKAIELGDLLGRPEVVADLKVVSDMLNNKIILVTGAAGSIGSELCRQIAAFGPRQLILTDSSEFHLYTLDIEIRESYPNLDIITCIMDVRDKARVSALFSKFQPTSVFHAAALKHVPLVEDNPLEAIKTNLLGTRNVANAAVEQGVMNFVMISTDKAVNPTNVMGATKRAAEAYCQSLDVDSPKTRFKTVRFGNVLGSNGSVVPRFQKQISDGGPITVTHPKIVRFFMTIPEAVRLVLNASAHDDDEQEKRGKIMVLDMGKPVRIVDLAERMIQLAGFRPYVDIEIIYTGLRPGEKLYEELFDPSEVQQTQTADGYVIASPRVTDKTLLLKSLASLEDVIAHENAARALELLTHIVPEYKKAGENAAHGMARADNPRL